MKIFKCPNCHKHFFETELIRAKCSENEVGFYVAEYCPKCMNKRNPEIVKLIVENVEEFNNE